MPFRRSMILLWALCLATCGSSYDNPAPAPSPSPSPAPSTATVSIVPGARILTTTAFSPNPLNIARGATVTWVNNDTSTHDATADAGAFDTGNIAPGGQASVTFQSAGAFPYHCARHPGMVASINVQ